MINNLQFKYASLNSNSLVKAGHPQTQSSYLRYLRLQQFHIISLQETHAKPPNITPIELQLQAQQYLWTYYCGIASFSSDYILTKIATNHIYDSERYILCKVHHPHNFFEPFFILNLYAPASSANRPRQEFFQSIYTMLSTLSDTLDIERLIISGDFNYDYERDIDKAPRIVKTSLEWIGYLDQHFHNCLLHNNMNTIPTYQHALSTIDYIFAGSALRNLVKDASVGFIPNSWSDHAILEVSFKLGTSKLGPGLWRGNPAYANNLDFQHQLEQKINTLMASMDTTISPQEQWERIKTTTKKVIKTFGIKYVNWRRVSIKHLERKRNRLLRSKPPKSTLLFMLPRIDSMLQILQQELVDIAALRAGDTWREKGERSAGYLKRLHQTRSSQQYMATLQQPDPSAVSLEGEEPNGDRRAATTTNGECDNSVVNNIVTSGPVVVFDNRGDNGAGGTLDSDGADSQNDTLTTSGAVGTGDALDTGITEASGPALNATRNNSHGISTVSGDLGDMKTFAWKYYQSLYSTDPVSPATINTYLDSINFERLLTSDDQNSLMAPITLEEIAEQANRSAKATAPGSDGLSYPFLSLLFRYRSIQDLVLKVYNDALDGIFPASWHDLRIRLLPKKGLLTLLKNWRPICLLGCDGKVFTRIITKRMAPIVSKIINPYQSGFLQKRFICDNGMALSMVLEQAKCYSHPGAGLLLDQEKAYDRVHADYLCAVMLRFGFPDRFVSSIKQLFFGNNMYVNVNGYFTEAVHQERGIRQGDPLSPLLFDIALEPFLLSIIQDPQFQGFQVQDALSPPPAGSPTIVSPPLKCLAYADDVCILMRDCADLTRLKHHMRRYAAVSNAKFNEDKSEAFSLNGRLSLAWQTQFLNMNIQVYHHQGSGNAFRYLGLYFAYTPAQRAQTEEMLLSSVRQQCHIYGQRQLSILGKVTIVNSLILSKIWYSLRLLKPTKRFIENVKKAIYQFVWNKKAPLLRKEKLFLPRHYGGLAVLDPQIQQLILQKRWLNYIFDPQKCPSFLFPLIIHHLSLLPLSSEFPFLAFLDPQYRKSKLFNRDLSIWHSIFELFDYFDYAGLTVLEVVPLNTLLQLPLHKLLTGLPEDHWFYRHTKFTGDKFMIYDSTQQRLRLRVAHEFTAFPRLCRTLFENILVHQTVKLKPCVWTHILNPPPLVQADWSQHQIIQQIAQLDAWSSFSSIDFRKSRQESVRKGPKFSNKVVKLLWSTAMHPSARTVLYRAVSKCIPHKSYLVTFGAVSNNVCSFCGSGVDTLRHFIIDCPVKWSLWQDILKIYYPHYPITKEILYGSIRYLHLPNFVTDKSKYISVLSTTFWQMWNLYWLHGNQNPEVLNFSSRAVCHIDKLIPSH